MTAKGEKRLTRYKEKELRKIDKAYNKYKPAYEKQAMKAVNKFNRMNFSNPNSEKLRKQQVKTLKVLSKNNALDGVKYLQEHKIKSMTYQDMIDEKKASVREGARFVAYTVLGGSFGAAAAGSTSVSRTQKSTGISKFSSSSMRTNAKIIKRMGDNARSIDTKANELSAQQFANYFYK